MGTDIYLYAERHTDDRWECVGELEEFENRHYEFFAILANVKNPIRSTTPYDFITSNRGFPDDLSQQTKSDLLLMAGHDPGWVLLRELLDFDWDGKTMLRTAVVDPRISHAFVNGKFERERIVGAYGLGNAGPGLRVSWAETYREAVGSKWLQPLFDFLATIGPPDAVRLVFSFDS
jgi:hypothetical protein